MQNLARKNLERLGFSDRVTFKLRDIAEGFDEQGVDAPSWTSQTHMTISLRSEKRSRPEVSSAASCQRTTRSPGC